MSRTCIFHTFNRARAFLPVIHLPRRGEGALRAIDVAMSNGADGVFLINQGLDADGVLALARRLRDTHKGLWVGINLLDEDPAEILRTAGAWPGFHGLWSDDCGVDTDQGLLGEGDPDPYKWAGARDAWLDVRDSSRWNGGLYFGGTAFKTQAPITDPKALARVARAAASFVDVVLTSGADTGVAASVEKVRVMREAMKPLDSLGLASGVTPKNVGGYLPYVNVYLVASGIESSFGVLDPVKTRDLAQAIHS